MTNASYVKNGKRGRVRLGLISGARIRAWWYSPRDGSVGDIGMLPNQGERMFNPPGDPAEGNDWVLVLDDASSGFPPPGEIR